MENDTEETRGPGQPSKWPRKFGDTVPKPYRAPICIHNVLNTWQLRLILSAIKLYPWFHDKQMALLGELVSREEASLRQNFPNFDKKILALLKKKP